MNAGKIAAGYRLSQWSEIIESRNASGLNVIDFCKSRGISKDQYYYWQKKLRDAVCEELIKAGNPVLPGTFAEVTVINSAQLNPTRENTAADPGSEIRIEISGMKISAGDDYPPAALAALLKELAPPC